MKTIQFTAYPDGYKCSEPGDQSGDYVKLSDAMARIEEREKALRACVNALDGAETYLTEELEWINEAVFTRFNATEVLEKGKQ